MKKIILLFATLSVVLLGLTACPGGNSSGNNNAQTENSANR